MPRAATGQIVERVGKDQRVYRSLRYRCLDGSRHTEPLGVLARDEAEEKLRHRMADVERGWTPPKRVRSEPERMPTFHEFSADWWTLHEHEWSENTTTSYRWRLEEHLLGTFAETPLDEITFAAVEAYVAEKRRAGLAPRSINMTVKLMATILDVAVERDLIPRNTARGRGRRVREQAPLRSYIDSAEGIAALLKAAGKDRTMLTVLAFTGLRVELRALRWRQVDLPGGWLSIGDAKTPAGIPSYARSCIKNWLLFGPRTPIPTPSSS